MFDAAVTRRSFLRAAAAVGLVSMAGCVDLPNLNGKGVIAFKRSGRKRRISSAAKHHNFNRIYATAAAAAADPAHPGDKSKVVQITIPRDLFEKLFANGNAVADLRDIA